MYAIGKAPERGREKEERVAIPFKVGRVVEIGAVQKGNTAYVYAKTEDGRMHVIYIPSPSEKFVDKFPNKEAVLKTFFLKRTPQGLRYTLSKKPRIYAYEKLASSVLGRIKTLPAYELWRDFSVRALFALMGPEVMSKEKLNEPLGADVTYALFVALTFFPLNSFASNYDRLKSLGAWQMTKTAQQGLLEIDGYRKLLTYQESWETEAKPKGVEDCLSITCQAMAAALLSHYHLKKFEETLKEEGILDRFLALPDGQRKKIIVFTLAIMHNAGMVARKRVVDILKGGVKTYEEFLRKYSAQRPRLAKHGNAAVRLYEALALYM